MRKGRVPGYAVALVDERGVIWTEGFGYADRRRKIPVTPDTPFLIGCISKTLAATAIMLAVQDGVLDLHEPVITYLPDFRFGSRYEDNPEQKMTLTHLLSDTAGLPGEAVVGNNFEPTGSFEEHARSISGIWLRYPVGQAHYYTNIGTDLAAYILQVSSGMPLGQYIGQRLLRPLGMPNSTLDSNEILRNEERAVGHMIGIAEGPIVFPMLGAGGVYSSAADLAKFAQLHINKGRLDDKPFLDESLMDAMYMPHGFEGTAEHPDVYYGSGILIGRKEREEPESVDLILYHAGGGGTVGFLSIVAWYPEYGIGVVAVTNRCPNPVFRELSTAVTEKLIGERIIEKRYQHPWPELPKCVGPWWGWPGHHVPTPYKREWSKYRGIYRFMMNTYRLKWWARLVLGLGIEFLTPCIKVHEEDGFLCVTESKFFGWMGMLLRAINDKLQEVKPGLFVTAGGVTLDFTGEIPTWNNYRLKKR
jgi:CubicO group peptidase (beta-lactamase class C family)